MGFCDFLKDLSSNMTTRWSQYYRDIQQCPVNYLIKVTYLFIHQVGFKCLNFLQSSVSERLFLLSKKEPCEILPMILKLASVKYRCLLLNYLWNSILVNLFYLITIDWFVHHYSLNVLKILLSHASFNRRANSKNPSRPIFVTLQTQSKAFCKSISQSLHIECWLYWTVWCMTKPLWFYLTLSALCFLYSVSTQVQWDGFNGQVVTNRSIFLDFPMSCIRINE